LRQPWTAWAEPPLCLEKKLRSSEKLPARLRCTCCQLVAARLCQPVPRGLPSTSSDEKNAPCKVLEKYASGWPGRPSMR
jgi:hypothetical protein